MMIGIYCITNTVNGKRYIGQSWNITDRLYSHKNLLKNNKHHNKHLNNAWNKYGVDSFTFELIKEISDSPLSQIFLDVYEHKYMEMYKTRNIEYGYNKREHGICGKMSDETKAKISASEKGRPSPTKGMKFSDATRAKMSAYRKNRPRPDMVGRIPWNKGMKDKQVAWNKGKKMPKPAHNKGKKLSNDGRYI